MQNPQNKSKTLVCGCVCGLQTVSSVVSAQALEVSDHYPVEVLLKVVKSRFPFNDATSLTSTKFLSLFILSHLVSQVFT